MKTHERHIQQAVGTNRRKRTALSPLAQLHVGTIKNKTPQCKAG